jgi:hypothetical protein
MTRALGRLVLLAALIMMLTPANCWPASENQPTFSHSEESDNPVDIQDEKPAKKVKLIIRVQVPHNKEPVDTFNIYPYPVEPAKIRRAVSNLVTAPADLKDVLYALGYSARISIENPYPAYGWRMIYAFKSAVRKSGLAFPHGYVEVNSWREEMRPYLLEEVLKSNAFERQRKERYKAAVDEFKETRTEIEIEALRKGLFPIYVYVRQGRGLTREGFALVDQDTWWIAGTHKVAGLVYYWQERVKLTGADEQVVDLNEDNALSVEGGW